MALFPVCVALVCAVISTNFFPHDTSVLFCGSSVFDKQLQFHQNYEKRKKVQSLNAGLYSRGWTSRKKMRKSIFVLCANYGPATLFSSSPPSPHTVCTIRFDTTCAESRPQHTRTHNVQYITLLRLFLFWLCSTSTHSTVTNNNKNKATIFFVHFGTKRVKKILKESNLKWRARAEYFSNFHFILFFFSFFLFT